MGLGAAPAPVKRLRLMCQNITDYTAWAGNLNGEGIVVVRR